MKNCEIIKSHKVKDVAEISVKCGDFSARFIYFRFLFHFYCVFPELGICIRVGNPLEEKGKTVGKFTLVLRIDIDTAMAVAEAIEEVWNEEENYE